MITWHIVWLLSTVLVVIRDFHSVGAWRGPMLDMTPATPKSNARHDELFAQRYCRRGNAQSRSVASQVLTLLYRAAEVEERYLTCCQSSTPAYCPLQLASPRTLSTIPPAILCFPCCQRYPGRTRWIVTGYLVCGGMATLVAVYCYLMLLVWQGQLAPFAHLSSLRAQR